MADESFRLGGHSQWVVMGMGQAPGGGGTTYSDLSVAGSAVGTEVADGGFPASLSVASQQQGLVKMSGPRNTWTSAARSLCLSLSLSAITLNSQQDTNHMLLLWINSEKHGRVSV